MFITYPLNTDYLIPFVRHRFGDMMEPYRYSDAVMRLAITQGVQALQRRWSYRYLLFSSGVVITDSTVYSAYEDQYQVSLSGFVLVTLPDATPYPVLSGMAVYDVFRHPKHTFIDHVYPFVISQEDVYPVVLSAVITLRLMLLSSSAPDFQSWSDGQFSFSNLGSHRALSELLNADRQELDAYFKQRLAHATKGWFHPVL